MLKVLNRYVYKLFLYFASHYMLLSCIFHACCAYYPEAVFMTLSFVFLLYSSRTDAHKFTDEQQKLRLWGLINMLKAYNSRVSLLQNLEDESPAKELDT